MSRSKHDGYATYSTYNLVKTSANTDNAARFSNMPPPVPVGPMDNTDIQQQTNMANMVNVANSAGTQANVSSLPQPFYPHADQSRVNHIDPDKLYDLLMNPQYHYVESQKQPLRILIKVYTDWCKPCKIIAPEIKKLSLDPNYANILFVEIDGEKLTQHEKLASVLRCSSVPTFFTFKGGKQVGFMTGIKLDEIVNLCNGLL
jgi:thioredoxin 1